MCVNRIRMSLRFPDGSLDLKFAMVMVGATERRSCVFHVVSSDEHANINGAFSFLPLRMQVRRTHVHNFERFDVRFVRSGWGDAWEVSVEVLVELETKWFDHW